MQRSPWAFVALTTALLGAVFAVLLAAPTVENMLDPCHQWDSRGEPGVLTPDESCPSRSASSETLAEAVLRLTAIQGVLLLGSGLALWGALAERTRGVAAGMVAYVAVSVPLFLGMFGMLVFAMAIGLGSSAYGMAQDQRQVAARLPPEYALALVGTVYVVLFMALDEAFVIALVVGLVGALALVLARTVLERPQAR